MRWTDEVHHARTYAARKEAKQLSRGQSVGPKGQSGAVPLLLAGGVLSAVASCERHGRFRLRRLPFVGPWLSSKLNTLRWQLVVKLPARINSRNGKKQLSSDNPRNEVAAAALKRQANAQAAASQPTAPTEPQLQRQQQSQSNGSHNRSGNNRKKGKGGRKR